jgi:phosphoribosylglycinamide formyltransferase 1
VSARLVVLASGWGSNTQCIIDAQKAQLLDVQVVGVVSNHFDAFVLTRARDAAIPSFHVGREEGEDRHTYDSRLAYVVKSLEPDVVVLAGWMRILSNHFIAAVDAPIINIHPALPGEFPGTQAIERAFAERENGRVSSGVMVHLVPDEGVDDGPVLGTTVVPILESDMLEDFATRMHQAEHHLLVSVLSQFTSTVSHTPS